MRRRVVVTLWVLVDALVGSRQRRGLGFLSSANLAEYRSMACQNRINRSCAGRSADQRTLVARRSLPHSA